MIVLGLHGGVTQTQSEASAAIIADGRIIAAAEEERFVRVKGAFGHNPIRAIAACLKEAGITIRDVDMVVHSGVLHQDLRERVEMYLDHFFGHCPPVEMVNHQLAHLASAFYCSPFDEAMCLSYDGYGDDTSAALAVGNADGIEILETRGMTDSLGRYYTAMTSFLGFEAQEAEYKVMGLAPYGKPSVDLSAFIQPGENDYRIDDRFCRAYGRRHQAGQNEKIGAALISRFEPWYSQDLVDLLGPPRHRGEPVSDRHRDIAFAAQKGFERSAVALVRRLHERVGLRKLVIAGGCGLNCTANNLLRELPFIDDLFVQPAASDRGLSLGCALLGAAKAGEVPRGLDHVFLGPTYSDLDIAKTLEVTRTPYTEVDDPSVEAAKRIAEGKIVGWFQGRSEFGPRALGHRSILADASRPDMKETINARVKFREEFRPFAPAVTEEDAAQFFYLETPSPFMTMAVRVHNEWKSKMPSVTHVDGTARVQTVNAETDPLFHRLIKTLGEYTGIPVVLNTSFNVMGEPIVESPINAIGTFYASGLDALVLGHYLIEK